jgi:transposase InsO family protein
VLQRDFEATAPNQKRLADMTYVPTGEGWLYLALVLDLHARKLVGWAMSETMPQELTLCALDVALGWRDPDAGLVHHSDRGSQPRFDWSSQHCSPSAPAPTLMRGRHEQDSLLSFADFGAVRSSFLPATREQARQAVVEYIGYHNTERRRESSVKSVQHRTPVNSIERLSFARIATTAAKAWGAEGAVGGSGAAGAAGA